MTHLHVKVTEKTAYYTGPMPVCGNSDYMVEWELDQEWDDRQSKTMRVVFPDGRYQDTLFSGTSVALPAIPSPGWISVGLYAEGLQTRPAEIRVLASVVSSSGTPASPAPDVYGQLVALLDKKISAPDPAGEVGQVLSSDGQGGYNWVSLPNGSAMAMRIADGVIQYSPDGDTWSNLVDMAELTGPVGPAGPAGKDGADGSNASVTLENVTQALGYTPVSPTQLATAMEMVPDYVTQAADSVAQRMLEHVGANTFSFALFTDLHYAPYFNETRGAEHPISYAETAKHLVAAVNRVHEKVPLACVLSLGDNVESADNADKVTAAALPTAALRGARDRKLQMDKVTRLCSIFQGFCPLYIPQKGNHDDGGLAAYSSEADHKYYLSYLMQDGDYFARFFARSGSNAVHMDADGNLLACYLDVPACKVRMISLNCVDLPYTSNADGSCPYLGAPYNQYLAGQHCYGYGQEQLKWLAGTALQLPGKGWKVIVFQHIPMLDSFTKQDGGAADHQRFNYDVLEGILDAYQKGTAYSCAVAAGRAPNGAESTYFPCTVSADFTGQGARDIIAIWNGHIHRDLYSKTTMPTKPVGATIIIPDFINRFSSDDVTFLYNQRYSSSAANKLSTANSKGSLSNVIAAAKGDTIRIRFGASMANYAWPIVLQCSDSVGTVTTAGIYVSDGNDAKITWNSDKTEAVITNPYTASYYRFALPLETDGVIITVNQEITYSQQTGEGGQPVLFVSTMLACPNYSDGGNAWDGKHYIHTAGTAEETSIDFVTVDIARKKIYATRYGAGSDREMNF